MIRWLAALAFAGLLTVFAASAREDDPFLPKQPPPPSGLQVFGSPCNAECIAEDALDQFARHYLRATYQHLYQGFPPSWSNMEFVKARGFNDGYGLPADMYVEFQAVPKPSIGDAPPVPGFDHWVVYLRIPRLKLAAQLRQLGKSLPAYRRFFADPPPVTDKAFLAILDEMFEQAGDAASVAARMQISTFKADGRVCPAVMRSLELLEDVPLDRLDFPGIGRGSGLNRWSGPDGGSYEIEVQTDFWHLTSSAGNDDRLGLWITSVRARLQPCLRPFRESPQSPPP